MCANYTPLEYELLRTFLSTTAPTDVDIPYEPETYPGYFAPFIRRAEGLSESAPFERQVDTGMFGLVPSWGARTLARSTYNARTETVATKNSYRAAWQRAQFSVIPAANFFEPNYESGSPVRWRIEHADGLPLSVAGLWEWRPNGGINDKPLLSFTMLTISAEGHPLMSRFHAPNKEKRMIVLLEPYQINEWLQATPATAPEFFRQYDAEKLVASPAPKPLAKKKSKPDVEEGAERL